MRLFKAGNKPVAQLAKELGVAGGTIRTWASRAVENEGHGGGGGLSTAEREKLSALRKKNRELERERAQYCYMGCSAAAYFAKSKK